MITIPGIGEFDPTKELHEQSEEVRQYIYETMDLEPDFLEECEICGRPELKEWVDESKGLDIVINFVYLYPPTYSASWALLKYEVTITEI